MDRKEAIRQYKEDPPPAGVYEIRNTDKGIAFVGSAPNAAGRLHRHKFELKRGAHANARLQSDWNESGPAAFEFRVLDTLEPSENPLEDPRKELRELLDMWVEKLRASGVEVYET